MFWGQDNEPEIENLDTNFLEDEQQDQFPVLGQDDFLKMISLQEKYNYYKSLIKILTHNNVSENKSEKSMVKVMLQLIEYYAQCISEAQTNIDNIIKYFQHKIREVNGQYKKIMDKSKQRKMSEDLQKMKIELGAINTANKIKIPQTDAEEEPQVQIQQKKINLNDIKVDIRQKLMMALQNQNIEAHIAETNKKAEFLKKSIASSIKIQQDDLDRRRNQAKLKRQQSQKKNNSFTNTQTTNTPNSANKSLPKRKTAATITSNSFLSSNSELEDVEGFQIQSFVLQKLQDINLQVKLTPKRKGR